MERKEYKLDKETSKIEIRAYHYNINIYSENIESPIVLVKGNVTIENDWCLMNDGKYADIKESVNNTIEPKVVSQKTENVIGNDETGSIDLVVPKEGDISYIEARSESGNIYVKGLNIDTLSLNGLLAETTTGKITLEEFQAMHTGLETESGNINAEILESIVNYDISVTSKIGETRIYSVEEKNPQFLYNDRYGLGARSESGNIVVKFKGKR